MIGFAADPRVLGTVSEAAATRTLSLGAPCAPPFTVHTRFLILIGGSGAQQWPLGEQPGRPSRKMTPLMGRQNDRTRRTSTAQAERMVEVRAAQFLQVSSLRPKLFVAE